MQHSIPVENAFEGFVPVADDAECLAAFEQLERDFAGVDFSDLRPGTTRQTPTPTAAELHDRLDRVARLARGGEHDHVLTLGERLADAPTLSGMVGVDAPEAQDAPAADDRVDATRRRLADRFGGLELLGGLLGVGDHERRA